MLTVFSQNMEFFMERNMMVSVTVLAVFIARLMLSKIPKKYSYALWCKRQVLSSIFWQIKSGTFAYNSPRIIRGVFFN